MRKIACFPSGMLLLGLAAACGCATAYMPWAADGQALARTPVHPGDVTGKLAAAVPADAMKGRVGTRVGYVVPVDEEQDDYTGSVTFGVYYAGVFERLPYEAGIDLAWIDTDVGGDKAGLYSLRFDVFFSKWSSFGGPNFYVLGGMGASLSTPDDGDSETAAAVNFGAGLALADNRLDVRGSYSFMIGSDNIGGLVTLTVGYHF